MPCEPFKVVKDFEDALCDYTGAKYAVTTNSCTTALLICLDYFKTVYGGLVPVSIPKRTYVSVPMQVLNVGGKIEFRDEDWHGSYQLTPYPIWDAARRFTSGMYIPGQYQCLSFHWSKILGIQQGGAILHDDPVADLIFRRMRFDGRTEGVAPKEDTFPVRGWHGYLAPEIAAEGLVRLSLLPQHNADLPNSDYPDLSTYPIFQ